MSSDAAFDAGAPISPRIQLVTEWGMVTEGLREADSQIVTLIRKFIDLQAQGRNHDIFLDCALPPAISAAIEAERSRMEQADTAKSTVAMGPRPY